MQKHFSKNKDVILNTLLCLYLFYYSYRYVFKYNSSTTSPTYSDTPFVFKIVKYGILVIGIILLLILDFTGLRYSIRNRTVAIITLFFSFHMIVIGAVSASIDAISLGMLTVPILFFLNASEKPSIDHVEKVLVLFWWFSFIYEIAQILLYKKAGRLPALAYPTGKLTDVRFGGAWDDPNGYALILIFFIIFFLFRYKGIKQVFYVGASAGMLLLTWSVTGYICFVGLASIILLIRFSDRLVRRRFGFWIFLLLILAVTVFALKSSFITTEIGYFLEQKQGSVDLHKSGFDLSWVRIDTLLGIYPQYQLTEVGYFRLLSLGGIPAVFCFLVITLSSTGKLYKMSKKITGNKAIIYGAMSYIIAFLLSMTNLPEIVNFSCMGFLSICIILSNCLHFEGNEVTGCQV